MPNEPNADQLLVSRLLELTRGLNATVVAEAVAVDVGSISKWRKGKLPKYLHEPTRVRIQQVIEQPGWRIAASADTVREAPIAAYGEPTPAERLTRVEEAVLELRAEVAELRRLSEKAKRTIRRGDAGTRIESPARRKKGA